MIRHFPRRDYNLHPESDTHIEFFLLNSLIVSFIIPSHSVLKLNFSLLFLALILSYLRITARTALTIARVTVTRHYRSFFFGCLCIFTTVATAFIVRT